MNGQELREYIEEQCQRDSTPAELVQGLDELVGMLRRIAVRVRQLVDSDLVRAQAVRLHRVPSLLLIAADQVQELIPALRRYLQACRPDDEGPI